MHISSRRLVPATLLALLGSLLLAVPAQAAGTGTISGTVTARPDDGAAVPYDDATVYVDRLHDEGGNDNAIGSATPDPSGEFSITGLPDGTYEIRTYPHEYGELGELGYEYYDNLWAPGSATTKVQISNGNAITLAHDIELRPIGHIVGRVVDEQGEPVPGSVGISAAGTGGYGTDVDEDGYFDSLDGEWSDNLIPGDYEVSFSPDAWGADAPSYYLADKPASVTADGTTTVNFVLKERPTVTFTVHNSDGSLAAGAPVRFWMRDGSGPWRSPQYGPIMTDDQGRFQILDQADDFRLQFLPSDGHASDVPEYWHDVYAFGDAQVVSFDASSPLHRAYDVQLGAAGTIKAGTPTISGTAQVGQTLTLDPGTWSPAGVATSIAWFAGDDPIGTGAELTLTSDLEGQWIWARVTGMKPGEQDVDVDANGLGPVTAGDPPVAFATPTVSGTARVGSAVSAVPGSWGPAGISLAYQWLADGAAVDGATDPTLSLTPDLAGTRIAVRVTGTKAGYSSVSRTSTASEVQSGVISAPQITLTGTPQVGQTLTVVPGGWEPMPVSLSYRWSVDGQELDTHGPTLALSDDLVGKQVTAEVTGTKQGFTTLTRSVASSAITDAPNPPVATVTPGTPTIVGAPRTGKRLTARPGAWGPADVSLAYQWLANGSAIGGATGSSYVVTNAVAGKRISVQVTGGLAGATSVSRTSAPSARAIGALSAERPAVRGKAVQGKRLSVSVGAWSPARVKLAYQWLRDGKPVKGRTARTYRLGKRDVGHRISVRVVGRKASYAAVTVRSAVTGKVRR